MALVGVGLDSEMNRSLYDDRRRFEIPVQIIPMKMNKWYTYFLGHACVRITVSFSFTFFFSFLFFFFLFLHSSLLNNRITGGKKSWQKNERVAVSQGYAPHGRPRIQRFNNGLSFPFFFFFLRSISHSEHRSL